MATKRTHEPWMSADNYGRTLPAFTVNLIVSNVDRPIRFYTNVLGATLVHSDADFAALRVGGLEFMLHADHTYDHHPWHTELAGRVRRGLGAELRLFHVDPDEIEQRADKSAATILQPVQVKPHGWRDLIVADPDGYTWAIGTPSEPDGR